MAQNLYSSKFIRSFSIQVKVYTVQRLYGTKFILEKKGMISLEFNSPSLEIVFNFFFFLLLSD
jgi:hypothetical protein